MTAHRLYRCYDASGVLLYIGCTINPRRREVLHNTSRRPKASRLLQKYMTDFVVDGDVYPDADSGHAAEAVAIFTEQPIFNRKWRCVAGWLIDRDIAAYEAGEATTDWHAHMRAHDLHPSRAIREAMRRAA